MSSSRALHLVARPEGLPKDSDFELRSREDAPLDEGQIRVAVRYLSIDPAMRVWMTEAKSYWPPVALDDVMRSGGIGEVVESRNEKYPVGVWVSGMTGVQDSLVSDGKGLQRFDAAKLPHPGWALSLFSILVAGALGWWALRADRRLLISAIGLVMGGAIGNVIDRIRFGGVVDFIDFSGIMIGSHRVFPWIFNIADSAITIGVIVLIIDSLMSERQPTVGEAAEKS